jgi:Tfp pilus assembly protein PilO
VKKKQIPLTLVVAVGVLVAAAAAYIVLIRPFDGKLHDVDTQIAQKQQEIAAAQIAAGKQRPESTIKVADLVELAKAMPDDPAMADAILELNAAATRAGVEFTSISPGTTNFGTGYSQLPLSLTFVGNYYDLTEMFYQLRNLVTVRDGVLDATGRLFTVDGLNWHEAQAGFPSVQADLTVSAYVFGNDPTLAAAAGLTVPATTTGSETTTAPASTDQSSTVPTTTTGPGTTQPAPTPDAEQSAQAAAGVTP